MYLFIYIFNIYIYNKLIILYYLLLNVYRMYITTHNVCTRYPGSAIDTVSCHLQWWYKGVVCQRYFLDVQ